MSYVSDQSKSIWVYLAPKIKALITKFWNVFPKDYPVGLRDGNQVVWGWGAHSPSPSCLHPRPIPRCGGKIPPCPHPQRALLPSCVPFLCDTYIIIWVLDEHHRRLISSLNLSLTTPCNTNLIIHKVYKLIQLKSKKKKWLWGFFPNWGWESGDGDGDISQNKKVGTRMGWKLTPVPIPILARGLIFVPVPIPISVGGGDFRPMRGRESLPHYHP